MVRQIKEWQTRRAVKKAVGSFDERGLIQAIKKGNIQGLQSLLAAGIAPDSIDDLGNPALVLAVESAQPIFVSALLQAGARPDLPEASGLTPLMIAARTGNVKLTTLLLENHANPNQLTPDGQTALMLTQSVTIAKMLLEAGALADHKDEQGKTALMRAVENGHTGVVKSLLEEGADPNVRDLAGKTALDTESLSPGLIKILRNAAGKTESELLAEADNHTRATTLDGLVSVLETLSLTPTQLGKLVADARSIKTGEGSLQMWMDKSKSALSQVGTQWNLQEWEQQLFANGSAADTLKEELQWLLELLVELKRIGVSFRDIAAATHGDELNSFRKLQAQLMTGASGFADYMEQVAREKCAIKIFAPAGPPGSSESILLRWIVKDSSRVEAGEALCELQQEEQLRKVFAEKSGILIHKAWKNDRLIAGTVIGRIDPLPYQKETPKLNKLLDLALIEAVPTGNTELIRLLIEAGANPATEKEGAPSAWQLAADRPEIQAILHPQMEQPT